MSQLEQERLAWIEMKRREAEAQRQDEEAKRAWEDLRKTQQEAEAREEAEARRQETAAAGRRTWDGCSSMLPSVISLTICLG
jgi:hypothetical protein